MIGRTETHMTVHVRFAVVMKFHTVETWKVGTTHGGKSLTRVIRQNMSNLKLYISVLDEFPDFMTPTLVAHAVLGAHFAFQENELYKEWITLSFKKCVVRVNQKEFDKISLLPLVYLGHENNTLDGKKSCAIICPSREIPNVLKFAKLWKPKM